MTIDDVAFSQSKPRIIQHAKKRYALRLENVFWDALDHIARRRHIRLAQLVADLAGRYDGVNFSSYLRAYAMAEAKREQVRHDLPLSAFDVVDILRACPAPGLLMQHNRTIVEMNSTLLQWLGDMAPPLRQEQFDAIFIPRVGRPLTDTMNLLYNGQLKRTQIQVAYTPPPLSADGLPPAPRIALATLHGLYNPNGAFYCLVWFSIGQALQMRPPSIS